MKLGGSFTARAGQVRGVFALLLLRWSRPAPAASSRISRSVGERKGWSVCCSHEKQGAGVITAVDNDMRRRLL